MRWIMRWMMLALIAACACGNDAGEPEPQRDAGRDAGRDGPVVDAGDAPAADCSEDVPSFEDVEIFAKCRQCHASDLEGPDRNFAPIGADFDDYEAAAARADVAALYVFEGTMPPPTSGITVSEAEKQQFYRWALCGTPE